MENHRLKERFNETKESTELAIDESLSTIGVVRHVAGTLASDFNPFLAALGFVLGGLAGFQLVADSQVLAQWMRFALVILCAISGSFLLGRLGNIFIMICLAAAGIAAVFGVGFYLWKVV